MTMSEAALFMPLTLGAVVVIMGLVIYKNLEVKIYDGKRCNL